MSTEVDIQYTDGEAVANFLQGLGQACTLLPPRDRSVSSPESIVPPSACDSSHKTARFPGLASTLDMKTNWARSHVRCLSLRLRFPQQVMLVFVLEVTLSGLPPNILLSGELIAKVQEYGAGSWRFCWTLFSHRSRPPAFSLCVLGQVGGGLEEWGEGIHRKLKLGQPSGRSY